MKDLFPGYYYSLSNEELSKLWEECIFIFDTNVLLDFYEYHKETREDFFKVLYTIKDRLWIPHQVAVEYHENRIIRIKQVETNFAKVQKILEEAKKILSRDELNLKSFPTEIVKEMKDNVNKAFEIFWNKLEIYKKDLIQINEPDDIRTKITDLFQEKIGKPPINQTELNKIYVEGEQRYKIFRPPGFKDNNKDTHHICNGLDFESKYGDLILWKQILNEVKSKPLSHIIFITSDNKDDWWRQEHGKPVARRELVEEILEAGASMFYMYKPEKFLKETRKYLQLEIKEKSIQEVEEISTSNSLSKLELEDNSLKQLSTIKKEASNLNSYEDNVTEYLYDPDFLNTPSENPEEARHKRLMRQKLVQALALRLRYTL